MENVPKGLTRRSVLAAAGGIAALITPAAPPAMAGPDDGFNGLGLTTSDFNSRYGAPSAGQGASVYQVDGDAYYITNTSTVPIDRIVSVFWGEDSAVDAPPLEAVRSRLVRFLPDDAVLTAIGEAPGAGVGPRLRVDTYNSALLGGALSGSGFSDSGDMLIAYLQTPDRPGTVWWANLYVPVKP